ncbi:A disintegrin and metalloproteinase with thrombospondin motifs 18-like [Corticium candelabrum]|uniref:A disintegrin and metalloproteinase with thrombospondin motifs 18-like n=1 Tax=Corticium candelabrum TaxID=121492 RepID=UPI002E2721CF|nr:A disintegrin and metalloproteinase with thrombospondin motifs 18-like [Corticium candelabrum]
MWPWILQLMLCCCYAFASVVAANGGPFKGFNSKWLEHPDTDIAFPVLIHSEGFTSNLLPSKSDRNKRSVGTGSGLLLYRLSGFGVNYELQMASNDKLVSTSVLVQTIQDGNMGEEEVMTEYVVNKGCHLNGLVRVDDDNGSLDNTQWGRAAISVCDGNMTGVMKMWDYEVHIEVSTEGETPKRHILQKRFTETNMFDGNYCNVTEADGVQNNERHSEHLKRAAGSIRAKRQSLHNQTLYVETMVAVDKITLKRWKKLGITQVENYALTLVNIANMLWANSATGFDVRIVVTRMMFLRKTPRNLKLTRNSEVLLNLFCEWQNSINSHNESLLSHYDYAILITGNELCHKVGGKKVCVEYGRAYRGDMCNLPRSCQVATSAGFRTGFVIAHEMGHSFGMIHDDGNNCGAQQGLMAVKASAKTNLFRWSPCSLRDMQNFLRNKDHYGCLLDSPPSDTLQFRDRWAGSRYDLNEQCSFEVGMNTTVCDSGGSVCQALVCRVDNRCSTSYVPALDGSICGQKRVCVRGRCVLATERDQHTLVAAAWCEWSQVSSCSESCGGGLKYRTRVCNCPQPSHGGQFCEGRNYTVELCNTLPCHINSLDPKVKACRTKTDSSSKPMEPYYRENNACRLHCFSTTTGEVVAMNESVQNATKCNPTMPSNDRCFRGQCEKFGCDYKWQSNAHEDYCGVCQGTRRTCKFRSKVYSKQIAKSGYHGVVKIPIQATNIVIEEMDILNDLYLALQLSSGSQLFVLNGNKRPGAAWSTIEAAGTVIEYSRPSYAHETIRIKGPLQELVKIMIFSAQTNSSLSARIKVQYSMPLNRTDYGRGIKEYIWEKRDGACSKTCRGGFQEVSFYCRATIGGHYVNYTYCDSTATHAPKSHTIACNTDVLCNGGSPVYNWHIGNWSHCSATCGTSQRERDVRCYDETTSVYVDNNYDRCQAQEPSTMQTCLVPVCKKKPVNGGWSKWEVSGDCSKTCGSGIGVETRTCTNPKPSNGGKRCVGVAQRQVCCNTKTCIPTSINGFTVQCSKKYPSSKALFSPVDLLACRIKCQLSGGSEGTVDAEDGTRCQLQSSSRCLNQKCVPVGCDCEFGSTNTAGCGLCYNQSANCKLFTSKYSLQNYNAGRNHHIVGIPINAYHLQVSMKKDVSGIITIQSFRRESVSFSKFRYSGESMFAFGGEVRYTSASAEESLMFYGPTAEDLTISIYLLGSVGNQKSDAIRVSYFKGA